MKTAASQPDNMTNSTQKAEHTSRQTAPASLHNTLRRAVQHSSPSPLTGPEEVACEVACAVDLGAQQCDEGVRHGVARGVRRVQKVLDQVGHVHRKAHLRVARNVCHDVFKKRSRWPQYRQYLTRLGMCMAKHTCMARKACQDAGCGCSTWREYRKYLTRLGTCIAKHTCAWHET